MGLKRVIGAGGRLGETCELIEALLSTEQMVNLWEVRDAGMPVFVHTIDVTLLAFERFPEWQSLYGPMDITAVTVGSLLHDLTKATCRAHREYTHSWVMSNQPELAVQEAMNAIDAAQMATGVALDPFMAEQVAHIVASHHGPWGKVKPATPEAALVHLCDLFSAQHHRIAAVDANDILPILSRGSTKAGIARSLGVSTSVVRQRLSESCAAEKASSIEELLSIWLARGWVRPGPPDRAAQLERVKGLVEEAKNAPRTIIKALTLVGDNIT